MKKVWTTEIERYLKAIYSMLSDEQIAQKINFRFGTNFKASAIKARREKLKLNRGRNYTPKKYTPEVVKFIIENYQGRDNIELAALINEKFNLNVTNNAVQMFKANYKRRYGIDLRSGINRGFKRKGEIPFNKGLKWDEYLTKEQQERAKKGCFKKGNIPSNAKKIGIEKMRYSGSKKDDPGYLCIKVCDGKGNKNWVPKQKYIYEQQYGKIPKDHIITFADGDRNNFDINNLICISKKENLYMNTRRLRTSNQELTKVSINLSKMILKAAQVKNERL